jgi:hypothetical protein
LARKVAVDSEFHVHTFFCLLSPGDEIACSGAEVRRPERVDQKPAANGGSLCNGVAVQGLMTSVMGNGDGAGHGDHNAA